VLTLPPLPVTPPLPMLPPEDDAPPDPLPPLPVRTTPPVPPLLPPVPVDPPAPVVPPELVAPPVPPTQFAAEAQTLLEPPQAPTTDAATTNVNEQSMRTEMLRDRGVGICMEAPWGKEFF
jgi:hypothetical protein